MVEVDESTEFGRRERELREVCLGEGCVDFLGRFRGGELGLGLGLGDGLGLASRLRSGALVAPCGRGGEGTCEDARWLCRAHGTSKCLHSRGKERMRDLRTDAWRLLPTTPN